MNHKFRDDDYALFRMGPFTGFLPSVRADLSSQKDRSVDPRGYPPWVAGGSPRSGGRAPQATVGRGKNSPSKNHSFPQWGPSAAGDAGENPVPPILFFVKSVLTEFMMLRQSVLYYLDFTINKKES